MEHSLSLISPAKINLFLHINGRRKAEEAFPGYHELQTVFQILDYGDRIDFTLSMTPGIRIFPEFKEIPLEQNLIYKAAKALMSISSVDSVFPGVDIQIEKNLPMGGGLGGGSSNAATTLLALNHLWRLNFTTNELADIGAQLGADVPIFVRGCTAWAEGIGELITPLQLPEYWYLILTPDCHVNTGKIFSHERLTRDTPKKRIAPALEGQTNTELNAEKVLQDNDSLVDFLSDEYHNDCETLVSELHPEVKQAINWLNQYAQARMTGTGACCFARFDNEEKAKQVLNEARSKFKGFIAKGVNLSPALQRLKEANSSQRTS